MSPGAGKPVQVNLVTMLVQMAVLMLCPLFIVPGLLFCAMEWAAGAISVDFVPADLCGALHRRTVAGD